MRLGCDMDGVLMDFAANMGEYLLRIGRLRPEQLSLEGQQRWSLWDHWGIPEDEFDDLIARGVNDGFVFREGDPAPGSVEVLTRLHDAGHSIHIVTARQYGDFYAHHSIDWLNEHGYPFDSIHFVKDKTLVRVDLLLDDHVHNYESCTAAGIPVVLYDQPWNRKLADAPRVTWETFEAYVEAFG